MIYLFEWRLRNLFVIQGSLVEVETHVAMENKLHNLQVDTVDLVST